MSRTLPTDRLAYTIAEAADQISCSENTLRRLIRDGEVEAFRLGSYLRVSRRALTDYLERLETAARAEAEVRLARTGRRLRVG